MHSAIVEAQQRVADIVQQQVVVRTLIEVLSAAQDLDTNEIGQQCSNIRRQLQPLDVQLEEFKTQVVELRAPDAIVGQVRALFDRQKAQIEGLQVSFRVAVLGAQKKLTEANERNRQELLGDQTTNIPRKRHTQTRDQRAAMDTTHAITASLQRTTRLMAEQTKQSAATLQILDDSSKKVQAIGSETDTQRSVIVRGRQLISKLFRRESTDRLLVFFGVAIFVLTVLYILKKRLW